MKFDCQLRFQNGQWKGEHVSPNLGPIRVTAHTREEALRKLEAEIRHWLELCPCTGESYSHIQIEVED